tara:strand:- start:1098 stop:1814 length:717 start_codon:yes stop_codon:yes gene_type:complete
MDVDYNVSVENFEGPLDLLLFFIQRDKLNIYDIPISHIAQEFFNYLKLMNSLNINLGGEFLYVAAMLMNIKVKMLLPLSDEKEELVEDPRSELVDKLIEFKLYKEVSLELDTIYKSHSLHYARGHDLGFDENKSTLVEPSKDVSLFLLSSIFRELVYKLPNVKPYEIDKELVNVEGQISFLYDIIKRDGELLFSSIIKSLKSKLKIVVTFMAVLELVKDKKVMVYQSTTFGDILLKAA